MHSSFYGVLESKLNKTFFSSNSETSPFSLHLLSSIIAPLEMLIYSLFQAFRLRAVHSEQAGLFVKEV